jgi:hypothetical protein|tara:strand:+ start:516 stop:767 length:252 start_codon:yes stop_codon:yes gene_type:complete
MNFLEGKKSSIVFCVAIAVGLFQHFVGEIPAVPQDVWTPLIGILGLATRAAAKGSVSPWGLLTILTKAAKLKKAVTKTLKESP